VSPPFSDSALSRENLGHRVTRSRGDLLSSPSARRSGVSPALELAGRLNREMEAEQ